MVHCYPQLKPDTVKFENNIYFFCTTTKWKIFLNNESFMMFVLFSNSFHLGHMHPITGQRLVNDYMSRRNKSITLRLRRFSSHNSKRCNFLAHIHGITKVGFSRKIGTAIGTISPARKVQITKVALRKRQSVYCARHRG